jgi:hypothetical protein
MFRPKDALERTASAPFEETAMSKFHPSPCLVGADGLWSSELAIHRADVTTARSMRRLQGEERSALSMAGVTALYSPLAFVLYLPIVRLAERRLHSRVMVLATVSQTWGGGHEQ